MEQSDLVELEKLKLFLFRLVCSILKSAFVEDYILLGVFWKLSKLLGLESDLIAKTSVLFSIRYVHFDI